MTNSTTHSHPLELTDDDYYTNNSIKNTSKEDKPRIPPRLKIKQQSTINSNSSSSSNIGNENYCQNEINERIKLLNTDFVSIQPRMIRWLYKEDSTSSKWSVFNGLDSLSLECEFLLSKQGNCKTKMKAVQVLNRLFEVDILEKKCSPIYWEGNFKHE